LANDKFERQDDFCSRAGPSNSLVAGNLAGNFRKKPLWGDFGAEFPMRFQLFACQIPYSGEQGIL
jgi:hypothetical protein